MAQRGRLAQAPDLLHLKQIARFSLQNLVIVTINACAFLAKALQPCQRYW